jgi:hypothetical protein
MRAVSLLAHGLDADGSNAGFFRTFDLVAPRARIYGALRDNGSFRTYLRKENGPEGPLF